MKFLWDTNILIHFLRQSPKYRQLNEKYCFFLKKTKSICRLFRLEKFNLWHTSLTGDKNAEIKFKA